MKDQPSIVFDIESYDLRANRGWLVCVGWQEVGKRQIHMIGPDTSKTKKATMYHLWGEPYTGERMVDYQPFNDRRVLEQTHEVLSKAGQLITHYGDKHDIPFLNTRLIGHRMPTLPPCASDDLWRTARYQMNLTRNGLAQVSEFLQVKGKYHVSMDEWQRACVQGDAGCMDKIMKHCREDVRMTMHNRDRLLSLSKAAHPNKSIGAENACPKCGLVGGLVAQGRRPTKTGWVQRYFCKKCKCWCQGAPVTKRGVLR